MIILSLLYYGFCRYAVIYLHNFALLAEVVAPGDLGRQEIGNDCEASPIGKLRDTFVRFPG
jgi:hypothetical protein